MNADLDALHPYPFEKLAALKAELTPSADLAHIPLTIGEPQHAPYPAALEALVAHQLEMARYPATNGLPALRQTIANWASQRFQLRELDSERHVVPVNGTREAIFAFVQAALDRSRPAKVAVPNPFYQSTKVRRCWPAVSRFIWTVALRIIFALMLAPCPLQRGEMCRSCLSARRATRPVP